MNEPGKRAFPIPLPLLVLDMLGAFLIAIGLLEWIGGASLVPDAWQFNNYALVLLVAGGFLMLPMVLFLVKLITGKTTQSP